MAEEDILKTDLLIVGAGPAGASLACFLASHGNALATTTIEVPLRLMSTRLIGRTGIMIARDPWSAETPRAHITNMAGLGMRVVSNLYPYTCT